MYIRDSWIIEKKKISPSIRIKELLLEQEKTQKWLSQKTGINEITISKWFTGKISTIRRSSLADVAKVLNVDLEYLLCEKVSKT